jgi:hypothetical protein
LRAIKATDPDLVFVASYPAGMLRAVEEQGLSAKMFGGPIVGLQYGSVKQRVSWVALLITSPAAVFALEANAEQLVCLRGTGLQSTRAGSVFARGEVSRNAAYDQPERNAQLQHECAENEKAFAYAPVVGDPTHQRRDQDRGEPLPSLTQAHDRTLLMATDRSRLQRPI